MVRRILSAVLVLAAVPAAALAPVEGMLPGAGAAFEALGAFKAQSPVRTLEAVVVDQPPAKPALVTRQRYIRLSGHVYVSGTGHLPENASQAFITVYGHTQLQDERGRYLNGTITLSDSSWYFVNGTHVSGWARPSAYVNIYKDGRYLGSVRIEGSILVSGFNNSGWVRVDGSGFVEGSGWIQDTETPQTP